MQAIIRVVGLVVALVPVCCAVEWTHVDTVAAALGPAQWKTMSGSKCDGKQQSPIDIVSSDVLPCGCIQPLVVEAPDNLVGGVVNNGHTLKFAVTDARPVKLSGAKLKNTYKMKEMHFHWDADTSQGSEHTRDGKKFSAELHVVFSNTQYADPLAHEDGLAVVGIFLEAKDTHPDNEHLNAVFEAAAAASATKNTAVSPAKPLDLGGLVATGDGFVTYRGSLTTPDCNEVVDWIVIDHIAKISTRQLSLLHNVALDHAVKKNWRPVQDLNSRTVYVAADSANAANASSSSSSSVPCSALLAVCALCAFRF